MTFKEFCKKYDEMRMKYDIQILAELINLYKEYGKEELTTKTIYNELHDYPNYSEKEEKYIISHAEALIKEQSKK